MRNKVPGGKSKEFAAHFKQLSSEFHAGFTKQTETGWEWKQGVGVQNHNTLFRKESVSPLLCGKEDER